MNLHLARVRNAGELVFDAILAIRGTVSEQVQLMTEVGLCGGKADDDLGRAAARGVEAANDVDDLHVESGHEHLAEIKAKNTKGDDARPDGAFRLALESVPEGIDAAGAQEVGGFKSLEAALAEIASD